MADAPPTARELVVLASDVEYEVRMLHHAGHRTVELALRLDLHPDDEQAGEWGLERNACVEVFLLHTRTLIDFFTIDAPWGDDVVARHYLRTWPDFAEENIADDLAWLKQMSRSINKRLAHLTAYRRRVPKDDDARLIGDVGARVEAVYAAFLGQLSVRRRGWFELRGDDEGDALGASTIIVDFNSAGSLGMITTTTSEPTITTSSRD